MNENPKNKRPFLESAVTIAGLALVAYGLWGIFTPLAPLFLGVVLLAEVLTAQRKL